MAACYLAFGVQWRREEIGPYSSTFVLCVHFSGGKVYFQISVKYFEIFKEK